MAKLALRSISFFNGVPSGVAGMRGLGQVIKNDVADMAYDTELQLIAFKRKPVAGQANHAVFHLHPAGVAMEFEAQHEKKARDKDSQKETATA